MPLVPLGAVSLYYERRGSGPPLLLIMGATGDAGHFTAVAEPLADDFTVITYDRRGNSRSPRPEGWTATSVAEQADDAASLLEALRLGPAVVFGTSIGATIALCLAVRTRQRCAAPCCTSRPCSRWRASRSRSSRLWPPWCVRGSRKEGRGRRSSGSGSRSPEKRT